MTKTTRNGSGRSSDQRFEDRFQFVTVHGVLRIQAWRGSVFDGESGVGIARHDGELPALTLAVTNGAIDRDARQPRREPGGAAELIEVRVGVDIRLLHHVLDVTIVAEDGANGAVQPLVVAAHQDFVEGDVTAADALDDVLIGKLGGRRRGGDDGLGHQIHPLIH
jgi:hypothetical protein